MIVIIGPTGETARRIIEYARAAGADLRLLARDPKAATRRLGVLAEGFKIDRADAHDEAAVRSLLEPGDVLLNGVTPGGALGHGLARAAIGAGAHYVAFTGEVIDTLRLLRELDGPAKERGVTLCPGAGSSGAYGDLAVRLALRKLPDATEGFTGTAITGFVPSYGTLLSEMNIMNGPAVIIGDGKLVEEEVAGHIIWRGRRAFVERPLIDPMMIWSLHQFRNFRAAIEVPEEAVDAVSKLFSDTAARLRSDAGRASYSDEIAGLAGTDVPETESSPEGTRNGVVWNQDGEVEVNISCRPIYEATARAALLVSQELAEVPDRPAGFQAVSNIVRSVDYALEVLKSRVIV